MTVSEAVDDYLKAIFEIGGDGGRASTTALAKRLSVAPASVTGMLRKLAEDQSPWISYEKHRGATLTPRGRGRALEVIRHHRLIEKYLHDKLGYSLDEVHDEAEKLEHAISEVFEDRIAADLGHPEVDPHGHPIPRKDGTIPERREIRLLELEVGQRATVSRVSDSDPEMLRYLCDLGIVPGALVLLTERGPFDGPSMLQIGDQPEIRALGSRVAAEICVVAGSKTQHAADTQREPGEISPTAGSKR